MCARAIPLTKMVMFRIPTGVTDSRFDTDNEAQTFREILACDAPPLPGPPRRRAVGRPPVGAASVRPNDLNEEGPP